MKLLVSDYDGTLKSNIRNLYLNICAINKFIQNGNKFIIATGREYESIKKEINLYEINYDYLICNNGLIIFDKDDKIINALPLSEANFDFICSSLKQEVSLEYSKYYNFYGLTVNPDNVLEIYAKFYTVESASKFKKNLEISNPLLECFQVNRRLFIGNKATKATAISYLSNIIDIPSDDINDKEMLENFNGYKVSKHNKKALSKNIPKVRNVRTLVKKISKK